MSKKSIESEIQSQVSVSERYNPFTIAEEYRRANRRYDYYLSTLINALYRPNPDSTPNLEGFVLEEWTGVSTGGTSTGLLATEAYMRSLLIFQKAAQEFARQIGKPGQIEPVDAYHNFFTDLKIGRELGIVTYPPGSIPDDQYQRVYSDISETLTYLVMRFLPGYDNSGNKIYAPLLYRRDNVSITRMYRQGEFYGVERGGTEVLRRLIAQGINVFCVVVDQSESSKNIGMQLREKVPSLPDEEIIPFLRAHKIEDDRTSPQEIRDSYINCGNRATRDQQYVTIGANLRVLHELDDLTLGSDLDALKDPVRLSQRHPKRWSFLLNNYIQMWQSHLFTGVRPERALHVNPRHIHQTRVEPRSWFAKHDIILLLTEQARLTRDTILISELKRMKIFLD